jgi:mRNA interferase RelE/StbE
VPYEVFILRSAQKALADLPERDYQRVCRAIRALRDNPRPPGSKKLTGREGWRLRIGAYRVIYEIDDAQRRVTILAIGHRRDIYR